MINCNNIYLFKIICAMCTWVFLQVYCYIDSKKSIPVFGTKTTTKVKSSIKYLNSIF